MGSDAPDLVRLDPESGILWIHLPEASSEIIDAALRRVFGEEGAKGMIRRIWDARGVSDHQTLAGIRGSAELIGQLLGPSGQAGRSAVLVDDDLTYGVARQYMAVLPDGYPLEVFRSEDEARAWLLS